MKSAKTEDQETSERVRNEALPPEANPLDSDRPKEFNGPKGPEPTRYGDWERKGRCVDF